MLVRTQPFGELLEADGLRAYMVILGRFATTSFEYHARVRRFTLLCTHRSPPLEASTS